MIGNPFGFWFTRIPRQQPDLFEPDEPPELLDAEYEPKLYYPDTELVRVRLHKILTEVRGAQTLPREESDIRYVRTVFPQMATWLPEEEGAQLCFEFDAEMELLVCTTWPQ